MHTESRAEKTNCFICESLMINLSLQYITNQDYSDNHITSYYFAGGKGNYFDGGVRVPGILHWPGHVRPGTVSSTVISQMDVFPTLVNMVGGQVPKDRIIDGKDISSLLDINAPAADIPTTSHAEKTADAEQLPRALFFYCNDIIFSVRYGDFKFHYKSQPIKTRQEYGQEVCGEAGFPEDYKFECLFCGSECILHHDPPLIFNVEADPGEIYPLDPSLNIDLLKGLERAVRIHKAQMVVGRPLFSSFSLKSIPCCDTQSPQCTCNYYNNNDNMDKIRINQ